MGWLLRKFIYVLQNQTFVIVEAEANMSLPVVSCQYIIEVNYGACMRRTTNYNIIMYGRYMVLGVMAGVNL